MLARGEVVGVFQVESQGMRRALVDMRPDRFEDIIALVALYRPGPMANIPTYCARASMATRSPNTCIRCWSRFSRKPSASSSIRNR
jgi:DNA polymerase III alpha subunit